MEIILGKVYERNNTFFIFYIDKEFFAESRGSALHDLKKHFSRFFFEKTPRKRSNVEGYLRDLKQTICFRSWFTFFNSREIN